MANRKAFSKYSTIEEKLALLNKQRNEDISQAFSTKSITQSFNARESVAGESSVVNNVGTTQAFVGRSTHTGATGYTNEISLASLNSVISSPCKIAIENTSITLTRDGEFAKISGITNPQPNYYYDTTSCLLTYAYTLNGEYYYNIVEGNAYYQLEFGTCPPDGTYTLQTLATAYSTSGTTLTVNQEIYIETDQEVIAYGNLLYT